MAQDFSDPLTSVAYASSKTSSGHDPLLAPTPMPVPVTAPPALRTGGTTTSTATTATTTTTRTSQSQTLPAKARVGITSLGHSDPLSSSTPSLVKKPSVPPQSRLGPSASVRQPQPQQQQSQSTPSLLSASTPSLVPSKVATTGGGGGGGAENSSKPKRFLEVSSFSSPSSPLSRPFSDPLLDNGGDSSNGNGHGDHEPYMSQGNYSYSKGHGGGNSSKVMQANHRSTIASFPGPGSPNFFDTTGGNSSSLPNSINHSPVGSSSLSSTRAGNGAGTGVGTGVGSGAGGFVVDAQKAVSSSPRTNRRDSSYEQQRVKAPQYLHISIPETDRRGKDGMFLLSAQTNMPRYKRQSYQNITRSYLEFVRLREHLVAEHPEVIVPVLPPERSLVSASDIQSMRLFVERISRHPVLSQDYELQMFIESEFGFLPPAKPQKILGKLLNISVKRFSSSGSGTAASLGDTDDEFEEERAVATKVETKLQAVIKSLDKEIKARRDFSSRESELATLSTAWATSESLPELARTFKLLAKPLDGMAKASKAQVGGDATVLGSFLEYRLQHVQTLSSALDYRLSVLGEYDAAIKSTESKRKTMERLRSSTNINPEKVTDSIDDLEDAVLFEGNMKKRMEQISTALTKDLEGYRQHTQEDLLRALQQYSQRQIGFERAKLEELLSVGAGINPSGGLDQPDDHAEDGNDNYNRQQGDFGPPSI